MFFQKIGKQGQKYNLTMKLHKIVFGDMGKLKGGKYFKIKVSRGDHKLYFTTQPFKKEDIKCNKESHTVPMTLYFDEKAQQFLKKQIEIEGKIMNDMDESQFELQRSVINISQYMSNVSSDKFALEVQLNVQNKQTCVIKFHVAIDRIYEENSEESRSNNTNERNQSSKEVSEDGENNKKSQKKQPTSNYKFKQITPSETSSQKSLNLHPRLPPKNPKKQEKPKLATEEYPNQPSPNNLNKFDKLINPFSEYDSEPIPNIKQTLGASNQFRTSPKSGRSSKDQKKVEIQKEETSQRESPHLEIFTYQKKLKDSEKKLEIARRQIEDQKMIINKLLQEQSKAFNSTQMIKRLNQIESLKAQLLSANIKIGQLQVKVRHIEANEKENERVIDLKSKKAIYYEQQLTKTKLVFGRLMQRCYQTNDTELMAWIQEELENV